MLPAPTAVEAPIVVVATPVTPAPSPPPAIPVQEVTHVVVVNVPATSVGPIMVSLSIIVAPLLSTSVATASAPIVSPPPSSTPPIPTFVVLAMVSPSSSSRPRV